MWHHRAPPPLALTEAQGVLISIPMRHVFLQDKAVSHHCCYLNFGNKWKGFCITVKNNETHILCAQDTVNEHCPLQGCTSNCVQKERIVTELCCAGKTSITLNSEHRVVQVIVMPSRLRRRLYSL